MFRKCIGVAMLVTLFSWTVSAQDARTVINNASKAMGADNLKTLELVFGAYASARRDTVIQL